MDRSRSFNSPTFVPLRNMDRALATVSGVPKLSVETTFDQQKGYVHEFATDAILIDLAAVQADSVDVQRIVADCQLIEAAARQHGEDLNRALSALKKGGASGLEEAWGAIKRAGLDEPTVVERGGGVFWILAIAAAAVLSGCAHSAPGHQADHHPKAG